MTPAPKNAGKTDNTGCVILGVAILSIALVALGQCSSKSTGNVSESAAAQVTQNLSSAVAAQTPSPVQPLSRQRVKEGLANYRMVYQAEGLIGAKVFSQNCYDALSKSFSWGKLDLCGAFDAATATAVSDDDATAHADEASFFDPEVAAQRYLAAATGAGEQADEADNRWSAVQARLPHLPKVSATPTAETSSSSVEAEVADLTESTEGNGFEQ